MYCFRLWFSLDICPGPISLFNLYLHQHGLRFILYSFGYDLVLSLFILLCNLSQIFPVGVLCFLFVFLFIYLFLPVLGLRFCARASSSCGERGPLFIAVRGPLTVAASLVAEHKLQTRRLSNCGSRA